MRYADLASLYPQQLHGFVSHRHILSKARTNLGLRFAHQTETSTTYAELPIQCTFFQNRPALISSYSTYPNRLVIYCAEARSIGLSSSYKCNNAAVRN